MKHYRLEAAVVTDPLQHMLFFLIPQQTLAVAATDFTLTVQLCASTDSWTVYHEVM